MTNTTHVWINDREPNKAIETAFAGISNNSGEIYFNEGVDNLVGFVVVKKGDKALEIPARYEFRLVSNFENIKAVAQSLDTDANERVVHIRVYPPETSVEQAEERLWSSFNFYWEEYAFFADSPYMPSGEQEQRTYTNSYHLGVTLKPHLTIEDFHRAMSILHGYSGNASLLRYLSSLPVTDFVNFVSRYVILPVKFIEATGSQPNAYFHHDGLALLSSNNGTGNATYDSLFLVSYKEESGDLVMIKGVFVGDYENAFYDQLDAVFANLHNVELLKDVLNPVLGNIHEVTRHQPENV